LEELAGFGRIGERSERRREGGEQRQGESIGHRLLGQEPRFYRTSCSKAVKNCSTKRRAAGSIRRLPTCARRPPICASALYSSLVSSPSPESNTLAAPRAK